MKGHYFVNRNCLGCEMCVESVPQCFGIKNDRAYVKRQPKTHKEKTGCLDAKAGCPTEAIKRKLK